MGFGFRDRSMVAIRINCLSRTHAGTASVTIGPFGTPSGLSPPFVPITSKAVYRFLEQGLGNGETKKKNLVGPNLGILNHLATDQSSDDGRLRLRVGNRLLGPLPGPTRNTSQPTH